MRTRAPWLGFVVSRAGVAGVADRDQLAAGLPVVLVENVDGVDQCSGVLCWSQRGVVNRDDDGVANKPYQWDGNTWTTTDPSSNFPGSDSWDYDPDTGAPFNWTGQNPTSAE